MIEDGRTVSIEYTLKLDDGTTADSNVGENPLVFEQGANQILPGFERAVAGMAVEETRDFTLSPEEGYGLQDPELRHEVPVDMVPEEARQPGVQLMSEDQAGNRRIVRVHEIREASIVMDLNHPLAGQQLHFQVKILAIE